MSANEKTINTFATRVRQMILKFDEVKQENAELYAMVDERDAKIKALEEKLAQAQSDYDSLKMAKMMTISDNRITRKEKNHLHLHTIDARRICQHLALYEVLLGAWINHRSKRLFNQFWI